METFMKDFDVKSFFSRRKKDCIFLIFGVFLGVAFDWTTIEILIFLIFIWSILGPISSRTLVLVALFFLVMVPLLLTINRNDRAEEFSVYAYYFMSMAVIRGIVEVRREDKNNLAS